MSIESFKELQRGSQITVDAFEDLPPAVGFITSVEDDVACAMLTFQYDDSGRSVFAELYEEDHCNLITVTSVKEGY